MVPVERPKTNEKFASREKILRWKTGLRWLPTVLIVQHTTVFRKPLFYCLAKYDHETQPHNCYNIANYEK
jgi:hypothetical protein